MNNNDVATSQSHSQSQACAACKYQRRKCGPNCILAPYFPHNLQRQFLNAHKLFGISKITKIIKHLDDPHDKDLAMQTIIYQSNMRAYDPVGGCYRYIQKLQAQIQHYEAELHHVLQQLAIFREAQAHHHRMTPKDENEIFNNADPLSVYNYPMMTTTNIINVDELIIDNSDPLSIMYNPGAQQEQEQYMQLVQETTSSPLREENVNTWAVHNNSSLSSLQGGNNGNDSVGGDEFDRKPMLDLMMKEMKQG